MTLLGLESDHIRMFLLGVLPLVVSAHAFGQADRRQHVASSSNAYPADVLCGPISLSLASQRLGVSTKVQEIANNVRLSAAGTSLTDLADAAESLGLEAVAYNLRSTKYLTWIPENASAIVLLRGSHFAVVWPASGKDVWLAEYPNPVKQIPHDQIEESWDSRVLIIKRPGGEELFPNRNYRWLILIAVFSFILILGPRLFRPFNCVFR